MGDYLTTKILRWATAAIDCVQFNCVVGVWIVGVWAVVGWWVVDEYRKNDFYL